MSDVQALRVAAQQFNRIARRQLLDLGLSEKATDRRVTAGRLVIVEQGVFAFPPVLEDQWGRWMGATLTHPGTLLSNASAAAAWGIGSSRRQFETVTRPGSGGPVRHGRLLVFRSSTLDGDGAELRGVPITSVPRTLIDLSRSATDRALARALREAVRLGFVTVPDLVDDLCARRVRQGVPRLTAVAARYSGLPIERARSGAEIVAMEALRDAALELPALNVRRAGEEADLSWPRLKAIIEIDGGPFHLDRGEDARKEAIWRAAGWSVTRIDADDVHADPGRVVEIARGIGVLCAG